jgi:hypothetical protein
VNDTTTDFNLPCGTPIIEKIKAELATFLSPQVLGGGGGINNNNNDNNNNEKEEEEQQKQLLMTVIVSDIQERLDISIGKFWKM